MEGMEGMEAVAHNPPALKQQRDRAQKLGFSLIEAAIVLAVVGLVVAGIWVGAANVIQKYRINETAAGIIQISEAALKLFPLQNYPPTPNNYISATQTLVAAGKLPGNFTISSVATSHGVAVETPSGALIGTLLACQVYATYPNVCPDFQVIVFGKSYYGGLNTKTTKADCENIVRQVVSLTKNNTQLYFIQIGNSVSSSYRTLTPPFNLPSPLCPDDLMWVVFHFKV